MKLSTRSRYGLRAVYDIAFHSGEMPAQIQDISTRQGIPPRYLEQIFQKLKLAGILKSKRGPQGGYFLSRAPEEITVMEIISATEGDTALVECVSHRKRSKECDFDGNCITQTLWSESTQILNRYFSSITLRQMCDMGESMAIRKVRGTEE